MDITDTNRVKQAMEWFYSTIFQEEAIPPRQQPPRENLPSPIRTARSLETGMSNSWQSREVLFVKQAKLLANYEDNCSYSQSVQRYYPTYQSLTDLELRGYFSWRTKLRRGDVQKTSLSYAFLYIYELINQIGITDPMDGYQKLKDFQAVYGKLDGGILPYLNKWLTDYIIYYGLDPALLAESPQAAFDNSIAVLQNIKNHGTQQIMEAVAALSPRWLGRSKFYGAYRQDMDTVICRVLLRVSEHCAKRCKRTMVEQYFGPWEEAPVRLFESAVFYDRMKTRCCEYTVDAIRTYRCKNGLWFVHGYRYDGHPNTKLDDLVKTIDSVMRECYGYRHSVKRELDAKWLIKLIQEETQALLAEKKAAEAKKITIDYSQLSKIRRDAALTRDKLIVDEEAMEEEAPAPPPKPEPESETPLTREEYRLLQCLLYGRDYSWVRSSGLMLSVLVDSINEKLFDEFSDSVLTLEEQPELIEDYIPDLKERIHP